MSQYEIILKFKKDSQFPSVKAVAFYRELLKLGEITSTYPNIFQGDNIDEIKEFKFYLNSNDKKDFIEKNIAKIIKSEPEFEKIEINPVLPKYSAEEKKSKTSLIRIEEWKINKMSNYIGELIIAKSNLMNLIYHLKFINDLKKLKELYKEFYVAFQNIDDIVFQLNELNLSIKMVNFETLFNKLGRITRELCKDKKIRLILSGTDTQIEKNIIDDINDPLLHIIRNAVDHGIEPPQERLKKGKRAEGTIKVNAYNEADSVLIEISDDGRGIDIQKIKEQILKKKLATPEQIEHLSEKEIINFIFTPGFSTSEKITEISGRGVGMDVVKNAIEKMDGIIDIKSKTNKGTVFTIRIPLSLSIIEVIIIKVINSIVCIPVTSVLATLRFNKQSIKKIGTKKVIIYKDEIIPVIEIDRILEITSNNETKYNYVIITGSVEKRLGLLVEDIINKEEVMIKTLNRYLGKVRGLKGATILGDGEVALILNIKDIIEKFITVSTGGIENVP